MLSAINKTAVRRIERRLAAETRLQAAKVPGKVRLQPNAQSLFRTVPDAKGTVMLFHGFTAGPWQFEELSQRLQKEGYNVYAPRLPGHGLARENGQVTGEWFIGAGNRAKYDAYIKARFAEAEALGQPVWVAGLSGGANAAVRPAGMNPQVRGVFDMAPFFGSDGKAGFGFKLVAFADKISFGLLGRVLDRFQRGKNGMIDAKNLLPHNQPSVGAALAIRDLGMKVKDVKAPVQFVTTEGDKLSGEAFLRRKLDRVGGTKENGWFHFEAEAKVPHAMISPKQNKAPGAVDQLTEMLVAFVKQGEIVQKPPRV